MATNPTTTRKPALAATAATRRPALRAQAAPASVVVQPSDPSSSFTPLEDTAAYAIGYAAGLAEGQKIGAERERAALTTEESIEERMNRIVAKTLYPLRERAIDHTVSMIIYSSGIAMVVGFLILIWRLFRWI